MSGCKQCPAYAKCTATYRGSACAALRWQYGIDTDPEIVNTTDREKLIELIEQEVVPYFAERIANSLIANGVTVQKWISTKTPPKDWKGEGGYLTNYYVYTEEYGVDIGNYMKTADKWLCMGIPCKVTHWMPLPEPPKEVCEE